jgi:hypothetical protein
MLRVASKEEKLNDTKIEFAVPVTILKVRPKVGLPSN